MELTAVEKTRVIECITRMVADFAGDRLQGISIAWQPSGFRLTAYYRVSLSATDWEDVARAHRSARLRCPRQELDTAYKCVLLRPGQPLPQPAGVHWLYRQAGALEVQPLVSAG